MTEPMSPRENNSGIRKAVQRGFAGEPLTRADVMGALGGVRGILESFLPAFIFLVIYAFTDNLLVSAIAPTVAGFLAFIIRAIQRINVLPALIGLGGILLCSITALFTGNAEDYFLPGFILNIAWFLGLLISIIVRWPLLGFVLGLSTGSLTAWRDNQRMRGAAYLASYVWLALFFVRLAVQIPLYLIDDVTWLGIARLSMGIPLFALVIVFTWLIFRAFAPVADTEDDMN